MKDAYIHAVTLCACVRVLLACVCCHLPALPAQMCVCVCVCVLQEADENGSDGLDIDEFKTAFGEILGQGKSDQQVCVCVCVCVCACVRACAACVCVLPPPCPTCPQMAIMFMKIDTNCDGTVDWDEFCTYMLLEYQEKDSMTRSGHLPYPYPLRTVARQVLRRPGVRWEWCRREGLVGVVQEGGAGGSGAGGRGWWEWHR